MAKDFSRITKHGGSNTLPPAKNNSEGKVQVSDFVRQKAAQHAQQLQQMDTQTKQDNKQMIQAGQSGNRKGFNSEAHRAMRMNARLEFDRAQVPKKSFAELADEAEQVYQSYVASDAYKQKRESYMQEAASRGVDPYAFIGLAFNYEDQTEQELKTRADYYRNQAQQEADDAVTVRNMNEFKTWSPTDQAALMQYVAQNNAEPFAGEPSFQNARYNAQELIDKYGAKKVMEMAESYRRAKNQEISETAGTMAQEAADGPGKGELHSILSVGANVANAMTSPVGYLQEMVNRTGQYSTLDPNNAGNLFSQYSGNVRQKVAENLRGDEYDEQGNLAKDGGLWGDAKATLYEAGMSAADSLARIFFVGGNQAVSLGLAATGSFGQTVSDASSRGADPVQAVAMGIVDGGLEVLTEKISLDNLFKEAAAGPKNLKQVMKSIFKSGAIEVSEEELSFLGSTIAEAAILQEKSDYNQQVGQLMARGKSYGQARQEANKALLTEAVETAVQSFLSGSMMGGGAQVANTRRTSKMGKKFAEMNFDKADIQDLIDSGLESDTDTEAFQIAREIQKQVDEGKKPSNYDLARLWQANEAAIQEEEASRAEGAEIIEPQAPQLGATTDVTENAPSVTPEAQSVVENRRNVTQDAQNVTQTAPNVTAAPVSVAAQLRQNQTMNGGNINGTEQRIAGPAAAQIAGTAADTGAGVLPGSGQRFDGAGTREQVGGLAGRAGSAAQNQALIDQRRATVDRQNRIRSLRLPRISSKELGLPSGTDSRNIQLVPQEHYDAEMEQLSQRVYQETGKTVSFVMGRLQVRGADGNVRNINGVVYEDRIVVRADHLRLSMEQIADHEAYHGRVDYFGDSLNQEIRRHIVETYSEEEFRAVLGKYVEALRGVYDVGENQSGEDYAQLMKQIQEEVFADAYAGINAFGAGADRFTSAVNEKMEQLGTGRFRSQENGVRETNGPPADVSGQKENTAGYGGERYLSERPDSQTFGTGEEENADDVYLSDDEFQERYGLKLPSLQDDAEKYVQKYSVDDNNDSGKATYPVKKKSNGVTQAEIDAIQNIGRISVNAFSSNNLNTAKRFAEQYWAQMGVKSPFFRAWFGDWRVNDHKTRVQVADQIGNNRGVQHNDDTGWDIQVSGMVFNETKRHTDSYNVAARPYLSYINDIVKKAVLLDSYGMDPTKVKSSNSLLMHSLYAIADVGNGPEVIKLYVEEMNNPTETDTSKRAYQLQNIEKYQPQNGSSQITASSISSATGNKYTVADLFGYVKAKDSSFSPNPSSEVVNADGSPMKVYHGTNAQFNIFQSKSGEYWFSEYEDYAESMMEERGGGEVKAVYLNMKNPYRAKLKPGQFSDPGFEGPIIQKAKQLGHDGVIIENDTANPLEADCFYVVFNSNQIKSATDNFGTFDGTNPDIRYSVDDESDVEEQQVQEPEQKQEKPKRRSIKPVAESRPILAKKDLHSTMMNLFSIPDGSRAELGAVIDGYADRLIKNGALTEADRKAFFDRMYASGVMTMPADDYFSEGRNLLKGGRVYVPDSVRNEFGDDWGEIRRRAFGAGIYFTSDRSAGGIDSWNHELAEELPGLFDSEETDLRSILERIVEVAEEGKDEKLSLAEYTARLAEQDYISEREFLDNMERQMDWALRTFAEKARLEVHLRDRTGARIAKERAEHQEMAQRQKDRKELRELQQKTLKTLQWLNKNRNRAPEELKAAFDEVLSDIDIYAVGAANEMRWSDKYNANWKDLGQMFKDAMKNDPNFLPSKELEKIVARLDGTKIAEMDLGALNDLYKAAVGLRTEFYNRNNVISDEMNRLFAEVYTDAKKEIEAAPGGFTGKKMDKLLNLDQLTPMNVLQRMGGWDPNGAFYSMAKQLEKGERDMRAYSVKAQKMLQDFLTEHEDWVKKADGQGKDGIWYEIEIPELIALELGKKPQFGATIKVSMTPAQKVHMYLESKNVDNLRHMTGGRTFADKKLYSEGKRQEALAQGKTVRMAPETVKAIVSDLTAEEMELARILEQYYNSFATQEINRVSNILYGYDKAMGKNYAPIYTNRNYTKTEFGVFDQTAEGVGNLKGRQYAVNPSYNISAFDAFEKHVDQTARFVGMAIPSRNWTTLMNWREQKNSTGDVITHKWGEEGKRYITDLLNTLQAGDDTKSDTVSSAVSKLQSTYITAIFGANPSIVLKQLGSIPLASAYLDARNMPSAQQIKDIDRELIGKYSQDLAWRTMGYSTPETRQLKENPNWTQTNKYYRFAFGGGAITAMDGWAASVLWPWAENKVRRDFPDLEVGTQEQIEKGESPFYKKVAELFEDALSRSQSTSDEIHQSSLRKSKNPVTKAFTMFRSDSAQTYNALRQKIGEAQYYMRTDAKEQVKEHAKKAVGAAFVSLLLNSMWAEAINFLMALWKNKGKNYRDDEEELTFQSVAGEMASGMVGSFGGIVTGGEEVLEIIGNLLTGEKIYDIETPGIEQLNDLVTAVTNAGGNFRDVIAGAADVAVHGGDMGDYFRKNSGEILGSIKELAETTVMYLPGLPVSGLPVSNLEAYLLGAVKWLSPELGAAYDDLFQSVGKSSLAGLEGEVLEGKVGRILDDRGVSQSEETAKAVAALYEAGHRTAVPGDTPTSISVNGEKHTLRPFEQQAYDTIWSSVVSGALDDLIASDSFREAGEEDQAKMLSKLYDYAAELAKAELFEEYEADSYVQNISEMHKAGLEVADCIAWYTETTGMKQAEKFRLLRQWNMPEKVKKAIMGTILGTELETEAGNPTQYAEMLDALKEGISVNQYLDMRMKDADIEDYLELVDRGMEEDVAYAFVSRVAELEEEAGDEGLEDLVKWRASVDFSDDVENQLIALSGVMTDSQFQKVEIANSFGVNPRMYVDLQELKPQYDADGNGSYKSAEIQAAIDAMPGKLTAAQKAALWQLVTGSTSAKNNPYSREVGQKILDAKAAAKQQAGSEEEEETFSDAVMKQLMNRGG